ncbi:nuclear transport factor 2 family protein [Rhodococcus wratislaviensis]|uniref:nuclear transport factor 2 family protein n=1 Tax=Rhodococcus wratislaviensis TaxID=44752 RepID=UPI00365ED895
MLMPSTAKGRPMTITTSVMTDEQRISVVREFLLRLDTGGDTLELFDDDALYYFPKRGFMRGKKEIAEFFTQLGAIIATIEHHAAFFNFVVQNDLVVVEGTSHGTTVDWSRVARRPDPRRQLVRRVRDQRLQDSSSEYLSRSRLRGRRYRALSLAQPGLSGVALRRCPHESPARTVPHVGGQRHHSPGATLPNTSETSPGPRATQLQ